MSNKKSITATTNEMNIEPIFNIRGIDLLNFSLSPFHGEPPTEFRFDAQVSQEIALKDKVVISKINLTIKSSDDFILGILTLSCVFEVENLPEIVVHKPSATELGLKLNQVTISTARGAMFGLFRGTILHHAILPIVDIKAIKNNN